MKRERFGCVVVCMVLVFVALVPSLARAETSTVFGGSLLEEGEVTITAGGGFPDIFVQFDFANSRNFNLALRAKFNYNLGLPFFGIYGSVSAPMRIGILKPPPSRFVSGKKAVPLETRRLTLSLHLDPGVQFIGLSAGQTGQRHAYLLAGMLGVAAMMSYQVHTQWQLNFGVDLPLFLTIEPGNVRGVTLGFNIPIELVFGAEFEINENYGLFARIAAGPILYIGNMAANLSPFNIAASFSGRLWFGFTWRR